MRYVYKRMSRGHRVMFEETHQKARRAIWHYIPIVVLTGVIFCAIISYGCWSPREKATMPEIEPLETVTQDGTADWNVYKNEKQGYELRYPAGLIAVSEADPRIIMTHSIPLEHPDPCDFRGDAPSLNTLTDFEVSIEVVSRSLKETIVANESDYLVSNFLVDDRLRIEPDFIDEASIGSLTGYRITSGVEGCGEYTYYFPLAPRKVLVVKRSFITELKPIIANYQEYLKLPGVIAPDEEEKLFNRILSTFRFSE